MPDTNIPKLNRKDGLYLNDAGFKGRGVFCNEDIKKGEILEVTPAVLLNEEETEIVDGTMLENYTFMTGEVSKEIRKKANLKNTEHASSVVLGMLTFCNHDEHNNAEILWDEHDGTLYYMLQATRDIPAHTEICTTYGDDWFEDRIDEE